MRYALHKLLLAGAVALAVMSVCSCSREEFIPAVEDYEKRVLSKRA